MIKLVLTFLLGINLSIAKEVITIGTFPIPQYVISEKEGVFVDLLKSVSNKSGIEFKVVLYPPKRTITMFHNGQIDGYFPGLDILNSYPVYNSTPFYYKKDYLFSFGKEIKNPDGKSICLTDGYPYHPSIIKNQKVNYTFASSDESCLGMLSKKRVDGFLVELHSGIHALKSLGFKGIVVNPKPLSVQNVYFSLQRSPLGKEVADKISKAIEQMKNSGELSKFFEKSSKQVSEFAKFTYDPTKND